MLQKRLSIQLFDEEGRVIMDTKTVGQDQEFSKGPTEQLKEGHSIRMEVTIQNSKDLDKLEDYLRQLRGLVPIHLRKKKGELPELENPREELLATALDKSTTQDELIDYLREFGYVFVTTEFIEWKEMDIELRDRDKDKYQWFMRRMKKAKDPKSDKYDPSLAFGMQVWGEPTETIVIYLNNIYHKRIKLEPIASQEHVLEKSEMVKFPHYMEEDEKERFRKEHRLLQEDKEREPSKFYIRWEKWIEFPNEPEE